MSRRWIAAILVLAVAAAAVVVVIVVSGSSSQAFRTIGLPSVTVVYPGALKRERPIPGDSMVFLAEAPGRAGRPGESLFVREAPGARTPLATDARLLNDLQDFHHLHRRLLAERHLRVPGSIGAVELDAEYPQRGVVLRQVDLIARTATGNSYHLVLVGPADAMTDAAVGTTAAGFRLRR